MNTNNILFIIRADRTMLIREMYQYIKTNNYDCGIVVLSSDKYCSACNLIDKFIYADSYPMPSSLIKELVIRYNIKGIFCSSNLDLMEILKIDDWLDIIGVSHFIPNNTTLEICTSKKKLYQFLCDLKVATPKIYDYKLLEGNVGAMYPLVLKPSDGQGSEGMYIVNNFNEVNFYYHRVNDPIIQEYIDGTHFTVDCFNDTEGVLRVCVPRIRVVVNGSNSTVSKTIQNDAIKTIAKFLSNELFINGIWCFQLIERNGILYIHDVNPRLSSGITHSIVAGIPFHKYIVDTLLKVSIKDWDYFIPENVISTKYQDCFILHKNSFC